MKYLDLHHRFIRFFGKLNGKLWGAHAKFLKPVGSNYQQLISGLEPVAWTDAEFDMDKTRAIFIEHFGCTAQEFDTVLAELRSLGYIKPDTLKAEVKAETKHVEIETTRKTEITKIAGDDITKPKDKLTQKQKDDIVALDAFEYTL